MEKVEEKLKPWLFSPLPPSLHLQFRRRPPTPSKYKCERRFVISGNIALTSIYHYVAILASSWINRINHHQWIIIITLLSSSAGTSMATLPGELGLPSWGFVIYKTQTRGSGSGLATACQQEQWSSFTSMVETPPPEATLKAPSDHKYKKILMAMLLSIVSSWIILYITNSLLFEREARSPDDWPITKNPDHALGASCWKSIKTWN